MKTYLTKLLVVSGFLLTYPSVALTATQKIATSPASFTISPGSTVEFDVLYPELNPDNTTGLGVKMYFDSSKLNFKGVTQVFSKDLVNITEQPVADSNDGDNNTETDSVVTAAWAGLGATPAWPGTGSLPAALYHVTFTTGYNFPMQTVINFTGDVAANNSFESSPVNVSFVLTGGTSPQTPQQEASSSNSATSNSSGGGSFSIVLLILFLGIAGLSKNRKFLKRHTQKSQS